MEPTAGDTPLPSRRFVLAPGLLERAAHAVISSPGSAVALTGPPGSGKSAFAAQLASRLADRFKGDPIWLSCESEAGRRVEATDLAEMVLRQLGREVPHSSDPFEGIEAARRALSDDRKLLVLDDVSDEGQVLDLLPSPGSGSAVILISRGDLRRIPFPSIELGPLPMPAAVELLREMAGNPSELNDLSLCESLVETAGGLPFAVQIVGAQIADGMAPRHLLRILRDELTRRSFVDPEAGPNSMRSALAATYGSLSEPGEALLRLLSLMNADVFTSADLERELGLQGAASDALLELVRLHLVEIMQDGAYRMHPAVRRFAREQLGEEELDSLATRLVPSHLRNRVLEELRREAIDGPVGGELSDHVEAQEYALRVAAASGNKLDEAMALGNLGVLYQDSGHLEDAAAAFAAALGAAEVVGDVRGAASLQLNLGNVAQAQGRVDEAEAHYRKGLNTLVELGDVEGSCRASILLADLLVVVDRFQEAAELYKRARESAPPGSDLASRALARAARLAELSDDVDRARELYAAALQGENVSDAERADLAMRMAVLELRSGNVWEAESGFERSLHLFRRAGNLEGAIRAALLSGAVLLGGDDVEGAEDRFEQAKQLLEDSDEPQLTALVAFALALVSAKRARGEDARMLLEEALAHFRALGDSLGEAHSLMALGPLLETYGEQSEAATVVALGKDKLNEAGIEEMAPETGLVQMALQRR